MSYTAKQFANYLGISDRVLYDWVKANKVPQPSFYSSRGRSSGAKTRMWHDSVVHKCKHLAAKEVGNKETQAERQAKTFDLALSISSALAQKGKRWAAKA